jgi:hypothetical protein
MEACANTSEIQKFDYSIKCEKLQGKTGWNVIIALCLTRSSSYILGALQ